MWGEGGEKKQPFYYLYSSSLCLFQLLIFTTLYFICWHFGLLVDKCSYRHKLWLYTQLHQTYKENLYDNHALLKQDLSYLLVLHVSLYVCVKITFVTKADIYSIQLSKGVQKIVHIFPLNLVVLAATSVFRNCFLKLD